MDYEVIRFEINVPLADGATMWTMCEVDSCETAGVLIGTLLAPAVDGPTRIEIVKKKVVRKGASL